MLDLNLVEFSPEEKKAQMHDYAALALSFLHPIKQTLIALHPNPSTSSCI